MKFKIRSIAHTCHVESGIYKVQIIDCNIHEVKNGREQLRTELEVLSAGQFESCCFCYCMMLEQKSSYFLKRLLNALKIEVESEELDTEDFKYKPFLITIENPELYNGGPNRYPTVVDVEPLSNYQG